MKPLLLIALLTGCVVPYGDAPQTSAVESARAASAMGDLTGLEARLLLLMDENQDADRAARLEALRALTRRSRTWSPEAQRDLVVYLDSVLAVEERWRGDDGLDSFVPIVPVDTGPATVDVIEEGTAVAVPMVEEQLGDPEPAPTQQPSDTPRLPDAPEIPDEGPPETDTPDRSPEAIRDDGLAAARELLASGDYPAAVERLDALSDELAQAGAGGELDEEHTALYAEAVDGFVHAERERAGRLFLDARAQADADARRAGLQEVIGILEGLLTDYPDSSYASAINRNLQLVKRELGDG